MNSWPLDYKMVRNINPNFEEWTNKNEGGRSQKSDFEPLDQN